MHSPAVQLVVFFAILRRLQSPRRGASFLFRPPLGRASISDLMAEPSSQVRRRIAFCSEHGTHPAGWVLLTISNPCLMLSLISFINPSSVYALPPPDSATLEVLHDATSSLSFYCIVSMI
jgi:hypothetical protein